LDDRLHRGHSGIRVEGRLFLVPGILLRQIRTTAAVSMVWNYVNDF
jgi:hypothetical protein